MPNPFSNFEFDGTVNEGTTFKKFNEPMGTSTRSGDQQKKQRQKEFKERKEHQERLLAAKKANRDKGKSSDAPEEIGQTDI